MLMSVPGTTDPTIAPPAPDAPEANPPIKVPAEPLPRPPALKVVAPTSSRPDETARRAAPVKPQEAPVARTAPDVPPPPPAAEVEAPTARDASETARQSAPPAKPVASGRQKP